MGDFDAQAPVLVAVGEASGGTLGLEWPSPVDLAGAAIKAALSDSGQAAALTPAIDAVVALRTFEDSGVPLGTGSPDNVPHAYAQAGGVNPAHYYYSDIGGQTPQALVNRFASAVQRGEHKAVLIVGAEANGTAKRARKQGIKLDWRKPSDQAFTDLLTPFAILSRSEIRHAIISMPLAYSLIETARRVRLGKDLAAYSAEMAQLWAAFSQKSLAREHAQFAKGWSAEALQQAGDGNYQLTQIYRRWMVAQDAVDVAAALVLTTAGTARDLGIAADKMIWLAGAAEASEPVISERANLSGSDAQAFAVSAALDQAGITAADLGPVDIYSCFPCAVFAATDSMGVPVRALGDYTLTGGLSFFGGPGNCYALHSLTAMVQALRKDGSKPAMVTANGGVMSKQAVGIYNAAQPVRPWTGAVATGYQAAPVELDHEPSGKARILTFTQAIVKDATGPATLLLEQENGARALAVLNDTPEADLAGQIVAITPGEKRHIAALV
jgi:acetyl-CoA C-acetyltransferase